MGGEKDGKDRWISAGLDVLAEGGVDQVRVEVVAERLGVTKGGFYRRFRDRRALLDGILEEWSRGRIVAIDRQTELAGMTPRQRLRSVIELYAARVSAHGMAIELAIRQWARTDKAAAAAVAAVDAHRLENVAGLYRRLGLSAEKARSTAVLFYSFIFGQSLLVLEGSQKKRSRLLADCAEALTDVGREARK